MPVVYKAGFSHPASSGAKKLLVISGEYSGIKKHYLMRQRAGQLQKDWMMSSSQNLAADVLEDESSGRQITGLC